MSSPAHNVEVSIATRGNLDGLRMCVASVLAGRFAPEFITIHVESDPLRELADFYMSQLAAMAREFRVKLSFAPRKSAGVFQLRQDQLTHYTADACRWVVFLDDDVMLRHDSLHNLAHFGPLHQLWRESTSAPLFAYYQGTKWDVSNTRGYANFELERKPLRDCHNFNVPTYRDDLEQEETKLAETFHGPLSAIPFMEEIYFCDTGFCLFDRQVTEKHKLSFLHHPENTPAGGEDALFALLCEYRNVPRAWIKIAEAVHLEKPSVRFSEAAYRKESVLRAAQSLGFPTDNLDEFLSWVPIHPNSK